MSTMKIDQTKIVIPRCGQDDFWKFMQQHFAHEESARWKLLAMLALRENAGWPLEQIGLAFDHPKGHVTRCLAAIKCELRERFDLDPEWMGRDDEENNESSVG